MNYWFSKEDFLRRQTAPLAEMSRDFLPREGGILGTPVELEITSSIRTRSSFNAQVVQVKVPSVSRLENRIAAKIYDPFGAGKFIHPEINPFKLADQLYTTEAAAYEKLTPLYGTVVPKYLGSYTFDAPTGLPTETRAVRLILYEYVQGVVMRDISIEATHILPQEVRKRIMYKVVDAEFSNSMLSTILPYFLNLQKPFLALPTQTFVSATLISTRPYSVSSLRISRVASAGKVTNPYRLSCAGIQTEVT